MSESGSGPGKVDSASFQHHFDVSLVTGHHRSEAESCCMTPAEASFLPPFCVSGHTYTGESSVLSEQHRIEGNCDIAYLIDVQLWQTAKNRLVQRCTVPLLLPNEIEPIVLQALVLNNPQGHVCIAKPSPLLLRFRNWMRPFRSYEIPKFQVSIGDHCSHASPERLQSRSEGVSLLLPMSVSFLRPGSWLSAIDEWSFLQTHQLRCTVRTLWCTKRTFVAAAPKSDGRALSSIDEAVHRKVVVKQDRCMNLPPLYSRREATGKQ